MSRENRSNVFSPDEIAMVHVTNRTVGGQFVLGVDQATGKDYSHRRDWFNEELQRCAASFAIDLCNYAIMSNHFHMTLRSRPDIVKTWDDETVVRRWLFLCPKRKAKSGIIQPPSVADINSFIKVEGQVDLLRLRLSDISWWTRLLCQRFAQRANRENGKPGKFWDGRFKAKRLLDEVAMTACAVYVELNPIRAKMAQTIEQSCCTSIQRRLFTSFHELSAEQKHAFFEAVNNLDAFTDAIQSIDGSLPVLDEDLPTSGLEQPLCRTTNIGLDALEAYSSKLRVDERGFAAIMLLKRLAGKTVTPALADGFLARLPVDELNDPLGEQCSESWQRCSDKGFLCMPLAKFYELVDWSARLIRMDKPGHTPVGTPQLFERLGVRPDIWKALVTRFEELFSQVAGMPEAIDNHLGLKSKDTFYLKDSTRELLTLQGSEPGTAT